MLSRGVLRDFVAGNLLACTLEHSVMHERAREVIKRTMIGQMAIATALPRFYDLGCSLNPIFLSRNIFCLQLSPPCPKMNKKINVGSEQISRFLSTGTVED